MRLPSNRAGCCLPGSRREINRKTEKRTAYQYMNGIKKIERIPRKTVFKQTDGEYSFVTGSKHPCGLKCTCYMLENDDLATTFTLGEFQQGYRGYGHGGACYAVMDEVMGRSVSAYRFRHGMDDRPVMTGEITCRYISPAPIGEKLYAYGRVIRVDGRKYFTTGEVVREDGTIVIKTHGVFISVPFISPERGNDGMIPLDENDPKEI